MTNLFTKRNPKFVHPIAALSSLALLLVGATALANPAAGQARPEGADHGRHHGPGKGHLFERWDKDNDGRIAISELPAHLRERVSTIDRNKDGTLTREEFDKGKDQLKALREKQFDKNGDGKVTDEERREVMRAHVVERFVEQDKNNDGALTESEVPKFAWDHLKTADANSDSKVTLDELKTAFDEGKLRPPHGGRGHKSEADMKTHAQNRFNSQDKNKDGYLTEVEVAKQHWDRIKLADANRDNKVSFDELTAAFKAGKLGHPGRNHGKGPGR